jgi:ABC-type glycerol-3-phosphate transport system substrate-binding protein
VIARSLTLAAVGASILALAACGEKPQTMDASSRKADTTPWSVSDAANPAFRAPGWKDGDQAAWEQQIRQRNQAQNDYAR